MSPETVAPSSKLPSAKARSWSSTTKPTSAKVWKRCSSLEGYTVDLAQNAAEGLHKLESHRYDLVLLDLMMPDRSGMECCKDVRQRDRETPIFMITAYGSVEAAVNALKPGANDYFSKPWDNEKLLIEIERMIARRRLERENTPPQARAQAALQLPQHRRQERAHAADARPGGAGGAQPLHHPDHRRNRHRQGTDRQGDPRQLAARRPDVRRGQQRIAAAGPARIDAVRPRQRRLHQRHAVKKGYFEVANRGTIFFDEIGTIGPETQAKLLRVIQEREFMPLGSTDTIKVDVRILAATNADLKKLVEEGKFREDLYYRLNVINLALPPLRERKEDIPLLVEHFFTKYCRENNKFLDAPAARSLQFRGRSDAGADGAQLAGQRARTGECRGARGRAGVGSLGAGRRAARPSASRRRHARCARAMAVRCRPTLRCSRSSPISSGGKSSSGWSSPTGARPKPPTACTFRCPR